MSGEADIFRVGRAGAGILAEGGTYHPVISGSGNYYFSADATLGQFEAPHADTAGGLRPFAVAGYTRFFNASKTAVGTADAVNCGLGLDRVLKDDLRVRLEVRVYETPASNLHAIELRIGIVAVGSMD
jgi:hypothetical protein